MLGQAGHSWRLIYHKNWFLCQKTKGLGPISNMSVHIYSEMYGKHIRWEAYVESLLKLDNTPKKKRRMPLGILLKNPTLFTL